MKKTLLSLLIFFCLSAIQAVPYHGQIKVFKQPDGSSVEVKLFGTEHYMRAEGLDGYTVIRDPKTQWICYAALSVDGSTLIPTNKVYRGAGSAKVGRSIPKALDITPEARNRIIAVNKQKLGETEEDKMGGSGDHTTGTPLHPLMGNILGLCIVVDFSDEPGTVAMPEFESFCNDLAYNGYGNNGSLRKYYQDVSGGLLDYENVVFGYFRAPLTFAQYDAMPYAQGAKQILGLALNWIKSQGFDFSTLSVNPDNSIMAINMMYTGDPPTWAARRRGARDA